MTTLWQGLEIMTLTNLAINPEWHLLLNHINAIFQKYNNVENLHETSNANQDQDLSAPPWLLR